jgi:hypothetical protein
MALNVVSPTSAAEWPITMAGGLSSPPPRSSCCLAKMPGFQSCRGSMARFATSIMVTWPAVQSSVSRDLAT